ncbi:MAG: hypothetical protein ABWZ54_02470 [Luteibacter sp.]
MAQPIKLESLRELVSTGAVKTATILGQKGGYAVLADTGLHERVLTNKTGQVKMFATTDTAVKELARVGLSSFVVDISQYEKGRLRAPRTDVIDRARRAAAALEHDTWFRAQVEEALLAERQGTASWHSQDDVWAAVMEAAGRKASQAKPAGRSASPEQLEAAPKHHK